MTYFVLFGTQISQRRMPPLAVIEAFEIFKDRSSGLAVSLVLLLVDQLGLETGEEAFHHGVVVAVAAAAHAWLDAVTLQHPPVTLTGVLHTAIAVMQQAGRRLSCQQ